MDKEKVLKFYGTIFICVHALRNATFYFPAKKGGSCLLRDQSFQKIEFSMVFWEIVHQPHRFVTIFFDKTFLPANRTYPPSNKSIQDTLYYFLPVFRFEGLDSKMGFHGPFRCTQMAAIVDLIFLPKGRPWRRTVQRPQRQPYVDLQHGFFGEASREPFLTIAAFQP
jgi:hypothetical protein